MTRQWLPRHAVPVKVAAELLGLPVPTLYRYIAQGRVTYTRIGGRAMFTPEDLEANLVGIAVKPEVLARSSGPVPIDRRRRKP